MRKMIFLVAVLFTATVLLAATLEPLNVKTGVWQITMVSKINGMPAPTTTTYKSCVKKEDLNKYPFTDPKDKCNWTVASSTGSKMEASGPRAQGKVEVTMTMTLLAPDTGNGTGNVKGPGQLTVQGKNSAPAGGGGGAPGPPE